MIVTPTPRNSPKDQAPFQINAKFLLPPASDPSDPYEDFGPKVIYDGTNRVMMKH